MARKKTDLPKGISLKRGRYHVDIMVKGNRFYDSFETLTQAIEARDKAKADLLAGKQVDTTPSCASAWTLGKAREIAHERSWKGKSGEKTALINASTCLEFFGASTFLESLTLSKIEEFVDWMLKKGTAPGTVNRKLAALSKMFTVAKERGGVAVVPRIPRMKEPEGRIRYLSDEEEAKLLRLFRQWGLEDHWDATVILIETGLRTGELWKLEGHNVNFNVGKFGVVTLYGTMTKNSTSRSVPLSKDSSAILRRRIGLHGDSKLFPGGNNYWYEYQWDRAKLVLGLSEDEQFVPHGLRHTCCSRLVQGGMPLPQVQKWMGHKTIQTTMRYAHLAPTDLYQGVDILEVRREQAQAAKRPKLKVVS